MLHWSMVTGWLPALLTFGGVLALAALIVLPPRPGWRKRALLLIAVTGVTILLANLLITKVWKPFPDTLPTSVLVWAWLGLSGVVLAAALIFPRWRRWWTPLTAFTGLVVVLGIGAVQINRFYGQYPTVGAALAVTGPDLVDLPALDAHAGGVAAGPGQYLSQTWSAETVPAHGTVSRVTIPAQESGFQARSGYVYLPPAYYADPRPLLPVLVLLAGQPGNTDAWLVSGRLAEMMDRYASAHAGLAPVVVMADNLGANFANPLCVDSAQGNVETYLGQDVPNWIRSHLQIAADRDTWAIAGLSTGGTCALQMAVRAPHVYGRFIDISGEYEPLNGSKKDTVNRYFHGDPAAYAAHSPVEIMKRRTFQETAGRLVVGTGDRDFNPQLRRVLAACEAAGMTMTWLELPGGHSWHVWSPGLEQSLDWLAAQTRLVPAG